MTEKKSFIMYHDNKPQFDMLTDEQAGKLIKAIYQYAAEGEASEIEDGMVRMAFSFISAAIDRDNEAYESKCRRNREIAQERERKKRESTTEHERARTFTKSTDNDNDSDNDNDNDSDSERDNDNDTETAQPAPVDPSPSPSTEEKIQSVVDLYHSVCTNLPKISGLTSPRKFCIKGVISQFSPDTLRQAFERANNSSFLCGKNTRNWKASFDWLISGENIRRILEGNYDDAKENPVNSPKTKRDGFDAEKYKVLINNV